MIEATETFQADDAGRPRAERPLAADASEDDVGRDLTQALEVELPRDPDESGGFPCDEAVRGELGWASGRERLAGWGQAKAGVLVGVGADQPRLDPSRLPRRDQLTAESSEQRVRHGRRAKWPEPAQARGGAPDQRIGAEAPQELRVVVIDGQEEPEALKSGLEGAALEPDMEQTVGSLPNTRERRRSLRLEHAGQKAVTEGPRAIARVAGGAGERIRSPRPDLRLERHGRSVQLDPEALFPHSGQVAPVPILVVEPVR